MLTFNLIVAMDKNNGIGKGGALPWQLSKDMKYFKDLTSRTDSKDKKMFLLWVEKLGNRFLRNIVLYEGE